jgi:hypothetical protein
VKEDDFQVAIDNKSEYAAAVPYVTIICIKIIKLKIFHNLDETTFSAIQSSNNIPRTYPKEWDYVY